MKKYSMHVIHFLLVSLMIISISSCSRKYGCYYSLHQEDEKCWEVSTCSNSAPSYSRPFSRAVDLK